MTRGVARLKTTTSPLGLHLIGDDLGTPAPPRRLPGYQDMHISYKGGRHVVLSTGTR